MNALLIGIFLLPCTMSDGTTVVYRDNCGNDAPGYSLKVKRNWSDYNNEVKRNELSGTPSVQGRMYAAQMKRNDRAETQSDVGGALGKKGAATQPKVDPVYLDAANPDAQQIFTRAHEVWGSQQRMMEMLSGIAYTQNDANRDGVKASPYISSVQDYEALRNPSGARARSTNSKSK